jgi:hypothetical protein
MRSLHPNVAIPLLVLMALVLYLLVATALTYATGGNVAHQRSDEPRYSGRAGAVLSCAGLQHGAA